MSALHETWSRSNRSKQRKKSFRISSLCSPSTFVISRFSIMFVSPVKSRAGPGRRQRQGQSGHHASPRGSPAIHRMGASSISPGCQVRLEIGPRSSMPDFFHGHEPPFPAFDKFSLRFSRQPRKREGRQVDAQGDTTAMAIASVVRMNTLSFTCRAWRLTPGPTWTSWAWLRPYCRTTRRVA